MSGQSIKQSVSCFDHYKVLTPISFESFLAEAWNTLKKSKGPFLLFPCDAIPPALCFTSAGCLLHILFSLQLLQHSHQAIHKPAPLFVLWTWVNSTRKGESTGVQQGKQESGDWTEENRREDEIEGMTTHESGAEGCWMEKWDLKKERGDGEDIDG